MDKKTYQIVTFGCKVNQYESQELREMLERGGWREAGDQAAGLCLVNTCTVTARADQKCRQAVRRLARENPGARVVMVGCYARRDQARLEAVDAVTDVVGHEADLRELLAELGADAGRTGISRMDAHHRAFLKVQDGCRMACAYCIVPTVRPVLRSRPIEEVVDEVRRLERAGYREMVLCGTHLGQYGVDLGQHGNRPSLAGLVDRLAGLDGAFRIRLSSLEASEVTDPLLAAMAGSGRVCPHLHLSLQSGSAPVLRRMNRPYTPDDFLARVDRIRARLDQPALTTDLIIGFPGETDADFEATCRVASEAGFSRIHEFVFSARDGTPAAAMPDRVAREAVEARKTRLAVLAKRLASEYHQSLVGRRLDVLVEEPVSGGGRRLTGTACRYVPVTLPGPAKLTGQLIPVRTEEALADGLWAVPLDADA